MYMDQRLDVLVYACRSESDELCMQQCDLLLQVAANFFKTLIINLHMAGMTIHLWCGWTCTLGPNESKASAPTCLNSWQAIHSSIELVRDSILLLSCTIWDLTTKCLSSFRWSQAKAIQSNDTQTVATHLHIPRTHHQDQFPPELQMIATTESLDHKNNLQEITIALYLVSEGSTFPSFCQKPLQT
jgi:hypothetical protein